jgi:alanine-glyoxylate transaminase/serine-glyoxylate transaminase/serine-pyruvate transaminase
MAAGLGAKVDVIDFGNASTMDMDRIAAALSADREHRIKAVLAVHVDTSTSIRNDIAALRATMDAVGHPALLMADCIASLGCDRFEMDDWGVDVMVAGSQKGLMVPPGMGFVFFNDRAAAVRAAMPRVSRYWDWTPRANPEEYYQYFNGTAPTHHLYGLRAALDMIHAEGIDHVWARHERLAQAIWAACDAWGRDGPLCLNVTDPALRSHAVTAARLDPPQATALRDWVEHNLGLTLGVGLGMAPPGDPAWHGFFRLGHMGHVNGQMILGLLGGIEAGLSALDIPHGRGAVDAAAAVIAGR